MKRILIVLSLTSLFLSCERDNFIEGPSLETMLGPFELIQKFQVSNQNVDFFNGETTFFTAEFSKEVDWKIVVTGLESGAIKNITGSDISLFETNATWDGSTTYFPMFKQENCSAELYVSYETESSDTIIFVSDSLIGTTQIIVSSIKQNDGLILSDFEPGFNNSWENRSLASLGGVDIINEFTAVTVSTQAGVYFNPMGSNDAPEGNMYYNLSGSCSWDWLIGMLVFPAQAFGDNTFELDDNPDKVYFNFLLNVPDNISNAKLLIRFYEDDNNDGVFQYGSEDMYSIWMESFKSGWQNISVRYSDLEALNDGSPIEPDGDGVRSPNLLKSIDVLLLADPTSGFSQVQMDYMIFTEGQSLNP